MNTVYFFRACYWRYTLGTTYSILEKLFWVQRHTWGQASVLFSTFNQTHTHELLKGLCTANKRIPLYARGAVGRAEQDK